MNRILLFILGCFPVLVFSQKTLIRDIAPRDFSQLPIKPSRTISFETTEGSYMDVDVSPDGKTLLISLLGDIYAIPAEGGTATQLTRGIAVNDCPVWSPDGKYIAFISDATGTRRLNVMDLAGSFHKTYGQGEQQVGSELSSQCLEPKWSPDGNYIASGNYLYGMAGGKLLIPEEISALIGFSGNGDFIYHKGGSPWEGDLTVNKYDRKNGLTNRIASHPYQYGLFENARVSPDGRWLTYMKDSRWATDQGQNYRLDSLMLHDLATGKERLLSHLNVQFPSGITTQHYCYSPDSRLLFIAYGGKIHQINIETREDRLIPFSAKANVDLGPVKHHTFRVLHDSMQVKFTRWAHRSPNGKQMVFAALNRLYVKDLPGGRPHIIVKQGIGQFQPAYSPDGKWIAYVTWKDNIGGHLWRVASTGGKPQQLTKVPAQYHHPTWSPDGRSIVFCKGNLTLGLRDDPGIGQVQVISLDDGTVRNIVDGVPLFNRPAFSPDGKRIIYKPSQQGADEQGSPPWPKLVSQAIDGKDTSVLALAKPHWEAAFPIRQIIYSPDGRYMVFAYSDCLYLLPVAHLRGPDMLYSEEQPLPVIRFAEGGIDPHWEDGGKRLSWSYGNTYFNVSPEKIIATAIQVQRQQRESDIYIKAPVEPDEIIPLEVVEERMYAKPIAAYVNARIITMRGNEVIENGTLVVNNGRFTAVGETGRAKIPAGAKIINLEGKTIMPGLIDMHSHIKLPPDLFPRQSGMLVRNLAYGITTANDVSSSYDMFGYSELVETGQMIGPRFLTVGFAVRSFYNIHDQQEADMVVRNRAVMGATVVKQYDQETRLQRQWLLLATHKAGLNMTNEVEKKPMEFISMIKDGNGRIEHNPMFEEAYTDMIKLVAASGVYLTPTLQVAYEGEQAKEYFHRIYSAKTDNRLQRFYAGKSGNGPLPRWITEKNGQTDTLPPQFISRSKIDAAIVKAGGHIVMGSHGEDQGIGAHFELWALQMGGLSNIETLRTATMAAAEALGMQQDIGSIEAGKIADFIILNKNPLEDIRNTCSIAYVMKNGILYDGTTLSIVWPAALKNIHRSKYSK